MTTTPRIFVAQMEISHEPEKNLEKVKRFFLEASEKKANIIVFPENFTGILNPLNYKRKNIDPVLFVEQWMNELKQYSKKYSLYTIAGTLVEKRGDLYYKTAYFINSSGEIIGSHDKIVLSLQWETKTITPGSTVRVFETEFGKIALLICRDIMYPELLRVATKKGADIVFCPTFWEYNSTERDKNIREKELRIGIQKEINEKNPEVILLRTIPVARSIENELFVVLANATGEYNLPEVNWYAKLTGNSSICGPIIGHHVLLGTNETGVVHELDLAEINEIRKTAAFVAGIPQLQ